MLNLNAFAISGLLIIITHFPLLIIIAKRGSTKVARLFTLHIFMLLLWGLQTFLYGITKNTETTHLIGQFGYPFIIFISIFFLHAISALDNNRKRTFFMILIYVVGIIFSVLSITNKMFPSIRFVLNSWYYPQGNKIFFMSAIFWALNVLAGHYLLVQHYWKNYPEQRKQLLPFIIVIPIYIELGFMNYLPALGKEIYPIGNFILPFYSLTAAYAILKHQILGIEIIIKRGIIYTTLITFVTLIYLISIVLFEKIVQGYLGYNSLAISIMIAFLLGLILIPLRNLIQSIVDKLFFHKSAAEIEEENKKFRQQMVETDKFKTISTLASGVAHEIKNPLTAINTFAEELPKRLQDKEFLEKFSRLVGKEVHRINDLVHDLLDYAKPSPPELKETKIYDLLNETLEILSNAFIKYNIAVKRDYEDIKNLTIHIDPRQIKQAIMNILMNAMEAMPSGGTLTVGMRINGVKDLSKNTEILKSSIPQILVISISDTGPGISAKDLPHIFDPFFTTKDKGTGLGLSVTQGIIEEHGGKLMARSKLDEGTTFIMELPVYSNHSKSGVSKNS